MKERSYPKRREVFLLPDILIRELLVATSVLLEKRNFFLAEEAGKMEKSVPQSMR